LHSERLQKVVVLQEPLCFFRYRVNMEKAKNRRKNRKKNRIFTVIKWTVGILAAIIIFVVIFVATIYGGKLLALREEALEILNSKDEDIFYNSATSTIYDSNGEIILYLKGEKDSYYLEYDRIPYIVRETFIVSEDRNFKVHKGIDVRGVARAFAALIENDGEIVQGGSTITQQLARNIFLSFEVSVERKIKEMFIATELEKRYDKNTILEFYVNNIYFANGYYGIEAAAKGYFDKTVNELTMSQLVFLCAIPNNPSLYDPFTNMEEVVKRRDLLLYELREQQVIDKTLYEELKTEAIELSPSVQTTNNYVDTYVKYCATIELMEQSGFDLKYSFNSVTEEMEYYKKYEEAYNYCNSLLFTNGYHIYTTINMEVQNKLQQILDEELGVDNAVNSDGIYEFQGSSVCIDNSTGQVIAIVGGRTAEGYKGYTLNRAYQSHRQPGSAIKPILIYTPLFELGYSPDSIVIDEKADGLPKNHPNVYEGAITLRRAVEVSKNTIAWKMFKELTADKALNYLKHMGFTKITDTDYTDAVSLGGMTYGVSAKEMAAAYGALYNDGIYRQPTCIVKIVDNQGKDVVTSPVNEKKIYEQNACRMMTDVLKGVLTSGTGKKFQVDNAVCAGKTGTTDNTYDKWFVGYSYYYTVSVWCGYDYPKEIEENKDSAGKIWNGIMTYLHTDKEIMEFNPYYGVENPKDEVTTEGPENNNTEDESEDYPYYEETTDAPYYEETTDPPYYEESSEPPYYGEDSGCYDEQTEPPYYEEMTDAPYYGEDTELPHYEENGSYYDEQTEPPYYEE